VKPVGRRTVVRRQRLCRKGRRAAKMKYAAGGRQDWAKVWVSTAPEANCLAANAIFLGSKFQSNERGRKEVSGFRCGRVEASWSNEEVGVAETEWARVRGGPCILARAQ
jgi:hypothetical protein